MKIAVIGTDGVDRCFGGRMPARPGLDVPVNRFVCHCILPMELRARKVHVI